MEKKLHILVVEDEEAIRTGLVDVFVYHGYEVDSTADGREGLRKAETGKFDLILLDVMLPSMNGFDVCNEIRKTDRDQPIIMLTAKVTEEDIVAGLRLGADDYVAKPFSITELVLRVEAVLRRSRSQTTLSSHLQLGELEVDTRNMNGQRGEETVVFTRREIDILQFLAANTERPVSREELLTEVWGYARNLDIETRTVDIHIAKLRRKIESDPKEPGFLVTVRSAGYRLIVDS